MKTYFSDSKKYKIHYVPTIKFTYGLCYLYIFFIWATQLFVILDDQEWSLFLEVIWIPIIKKSGAVWVTNSSCTKDLRKFSTNRKKKIHSVRLSPQNHQSLLKMNSLFFKYPTNLSSFAETFVGIHCSVFGFSSWINELALRCLQTQPCCRSFLFLFHPHWLPSKKGTLFDCLMKDFLT